MFMFYISPESPKLTQNGSSSISQGSVDGVANVITSIQILSDCFMRQMRKTFETHPLYPRPCRAPSDVPLEDGSDGQSGPLFLHHSPPRHNGHLHRQNREMGTGIELTSSACWNTSKTSIREAGCGSSAIQDSADLHFWGWSISMGELIIIEKLDLVAGGTDFHEDKILS